MPSGKEQNRILKFGIAFLKLESFFVEKK